MATLPPVATLPPDGTGALEVPPLEVVPPVDDPPPVFEEHPQNRGTPAKAVASANNRNTDMCGLRRQSLFVIESSC